MVAENLSNLSGEIRLIVCLARKHASTEALAQAELLIQAGIDWDYLLAAVVFHGVFPTFYKHLKQHFSAHVPAKIWRMMTGHNDKIRFLNLGLVGTYLQYHKLLQNNNIQSVTFKGPALALLLYDDLMLREFSDIDVLVSPTDAQQAQALLLDSGYKPTPERDPPLSREFMQSSVFQELECEHTFTKDKPSGVIDLHWQIQPRHVLPIDFNMVSENLVPMTIENQQVQTLSVELSVIVLSAHASRHFWKRLLWICDIAQLLDNQSGSGLDWKRVKELSDSLHVTPMVVLALNLANQIFGSQIPAFAKSNLTPIVRELMNEVIGNLSILTQEGPGMRFTEWKFCSRLISGFGAKANYAATEFFHPSVADYVRCPLPLPFYKTYYLLHPAWLLQDAVMRRLRS